jgi:hypothetical protein
LSEVHATPGRTTVIGKLIFIVVGIMCIGAGLVSILLVVAMFRHPGGIGAERLLGPVIGLVAFGFFAGGGASLYVAKRLDKKELTMSADRNLSHKVYALPNLAHFLHLLAAATVIGVFFLPQIIDSLLLCLLIFLTGIWGIIFPPGIFMWVRAAQPELDPWDESMWWIPRLVGSGLIAISVVIAWIVFAGVFLRS